MFVKQPEKPACLATTDTHKVLDRMQRELERFAFQWTQQTFPIVLKGKGWHTSMDLEIDHWIDEISRNVYKSFLGYQLGDDFFKELMLIVHDLDLEEIRHSAVHRHVVDIEQLYSMCESAVRFAALLDTTSPLFMDLLRVIGQSRGEIHAIRKIEEERFNDTLFQLQKTLESLGTQVEERSAYFDSKLKDMNVGRSLLDVFHRNDIQGILQLAHGMSSQLMVDAGSSLPPKDVNHRTTSDVLRIPREEFVYVPQKSIWPR